MNTALQVWAIAQGDEVLVVSAVCEEHASRVRTHNLPLGLYTFRVRARAWVRRVLRDSKQRCSECAARSGSAMRLSGAGPGGCLRAAHLMIAGGDA